MLTSAAVLLAMIAAPPLWWSMQLLGLPDIGDPFDVQAFRPFTIPDDRNAFVLYRQAADRLGPLDRRSAGRSRGRIADPTQTGESGVVRDRSLTRLVEGRSRRSAAGPRRIARRWRCTARGPSGPMRSTRDRNGSGRSPRTQDRWPSLRVVPPAGPARGVAAGGAGRHGGRLGLVSGGPAGAPTTSACAGRSPVGPSPRSWHNELLTRLTDWSADPRTTPAMVRRALDDVIACGSLAPSETYTLKAEYPDVDRTLDSSGIRPDVLCSTRLDDIFGSRHDIGLSSQQMQASRLRVAILAPRAGAEPAGDPAGDRQLAGVLRPACRKPAEARSQRAGPAFDFYAFGPEAPAKARALSPEALDRWLATTTIDATPMLGTLGPRLGFAARRGQTIGRWWSCWRASSTAATTATDPLRRRGAGRSLSQEPARPTADGRSRRSRGLESRWTEFRRNPPSLSLDRTGG